MVYIIISSSQKETYWARWTKKQAILSNKNGTFGFVQNLFLKQPQNIVRHDYIKNWILKTWTVTLTRGQRM